MLIPPLYDSYCAGHRKTQPENGAAKAARWLQMHVAPDAQPKVVRIKKGTLRLVSSYFLKKLSGMRTTITSGFVKTITDGSFTLRLVHHCFRGVHGGGVQLVR